MEPTNLPAAVNDLCGQPNVEATNASVQMDFIYELVNQFPYIVLEYVSEQNDMTITAETSIRMEP